MPSLDNVFPLGPTRQAGVYVSAPVQSRLVAADVLASRVNPRQARKGTVIAKFGEPDSLLAAYVTPDAGVDSSVLFDIEVQMSEKAVPDDEGWSTVVAATGMPAFWESRDGSLRSPRVQWATTKLTAKFFRVVVTTTDRARWGASIEVI